MPRLPKPGSDNGIWGDILNTFLTVEHNADGTQKPLSQSKVIGLEDDLADLTSELAGKQDTIAEGTYVEMVQGTTGEAIQATLDAVPASGGTVILRDIDYDALSTSLKVKSNTRFVLGKARLTLAAGANSDVITNADWVNGNTGIIIEGGILNGSRTSQTSVVGDGPGQSGISLINCRKSTVRDSSITSTFLHGIDIGVRDYATNSNNDDTSDILIENCRVTDFGDDGITTHFSKRIVITNCWAYDGAGSYTNNNNGFEMDDGCQDILVQGCVSYNNHGGGFIVQSHPTRSGGARWQFVNCHAWANGDHGFRLSNQNTSNVLRQASIVGCSSLSNVADGIRIENFQNVLVQGFRSSGDDTGIRIMGTITKSVSIVGFSIYGAITGGIHLDDAYPTEGVVFANGIIENAGGRGILCEQSDVILRDIEVIGCGATGPTVSVDVNGTATRVLLEGVRIRRSWHHGFNLGGTATKIKYRRCLAIAPAATAKNAFSSSGTGAMSDISIEDSQLTGFTVGVRHAAANLTTLRLIGNDLTGNTTAYNPSSGGAGTVLRENQGYVTTNSGATSVADGGTITHGLAVAPTKVRVTGSIASNIVSVTTLSSTTFTVAIKTDAGAAGTTQVVYWEAEA